MNITTNSTMASNGSVSFGSIILAANNSVSVLVCLLAAILVFRFQLHKKVVYRLALYQVLASLALAVVSVLEVIFINYYTNPEVYSRACTAIGWLILYAEWMKLLFTMWVTFHLFCFAVLHKNLKKLEVLYVVTSLLVPAVIAVLPFATHTYGLSPDGTLCYIYAKNVAAFIERFALWDGPAIVILLAASTAMLVMVIVLAYRACLRIRYEKITAGNQYWKALKQLLPLAAFPILFFILEIPVFIFHLQIAVDSTPQEALKKSTFVIYSLWSTTSGVTLIVHISVARCLSRRRVHTRRIQLIQPLVS